MKFLIDECLSKRLAAMARQAGYPMSAHLSERGMLGLPDWRLLDRIIEEDWTLVTRNSDDFRPGRDSSSLAPVYLGIELHAGLVCLNLPVGTTGKDQGIWFEALLDHLGSRADLTNQLIDVYPDGEGGLELIEQDFPENG
ncbi:MAG: DUF5615 family PIN-like protein [Salinarimonas sp.]